MAKLVLDQLMSPSFYPISNPLIVKYSSWISIWKISSRIENFFM